jgi:hypothetical protein
VARGYPRPVRVIRQTRTLAGARVLTRVSSLERVRGIEPPPVSLGNLKMALVVLVDGLVEVPDVDRCEPVVRRANGTLMARFQAATELRHAARLRFALRMLQGNMRDVQGRSQLLPRLRTPLMGDCWSGSTRTRTNYGRSPILPDASALAADRQP